MERHFFDVAVQAATRGEAGAATQALADRLDEISAYSQKRTGDEVSLGNQTARPSFPFAVKPEGGSHGVCQRHTG
jgi:hypothetical protein